MSFFSLKISKLIKISSRTVSNFKLGRHKSSLGRNIYILGNQLGIHLGRRVLKQGKTKIHIDVFMLCWSVFYATCLLSVLKEQEY